MLIAIHLLQNHAPSNLNRDDNGDPKDALFGDVRRARISSQALKRSIRWSESFRSEFAATPELLATRTQLLPDEVGKRLAGEGLDATVTAAIVQAAARLGKGESKTTAGEAEDEGKPAKGKKGKAAANTGEERVKTAQLMFLTNTEIDQLAAKLTQIAREQGVAALNGLSGEALVKAIGEYEPHAADIAMFGRMTTSSPFKNVEAAVQVAPALSTHAVEQEFDFYTAVDDISGETGAGFIGEVSFNSATYYKYFSVDWEGLVKNLQNDTAVAAMTVRALLKAALFAIPSGKQNSFAAHNLPDLVLVEVREQKIALSYTNAFVKPVRANRTQSLVEASAQALATYVPQINGMYGLSAERAFLSTIPFTLDGAQQCAKLDELVAWLASSVK
ncbi:type I-E CRISPR-associated protein Cas7/Cse4/CasC [Candidatus Viridilinea mediisalina]|uniref:Type I-E CRISPR-associated protein Cas7/Cse4/CasC n=1 Tax=Candidatus Viridilinea mediisalina TaxID=2024553 RepID=A0A2A6RF30_9CHLR|nr:type I-E CRISPR-associated protein Cas7/Cse4/CasC [Candidatus Viridilinea mediisalina]PDW01460.1 type I-E CRISPR-associated protein Cas7/Cse4/CasC [Candidatus Viridilinea mediisalina]